MFTEEQEAEPHKTDTQGQNKRDYMEMIRQLYAVEELQGYTEEEIAIVKKYFNPLPLALEEFWKRAARTEAIHKGQDQWIRPEEYAVRLLEFSGQTGWTESDDKLGLQLELLWWGQHHFLL